MRASLGITAALALAAPAPAQLHGFLDRQSAAPGETVQVHVNHGGEYSVRVQRSPDFDKQLVLDSGLLPASPQPVPIGSYALGADSPALKLTGPLSLEAWVNPSVHTGGFAGILTKYLNPGETAYGIYLMPSGQVSFYLGATGVFSESNRLLSSAVLPTDQWTHIVGTWDGATKRLYVDGQLDATQGFGGPIFDTTQPVRVGAFGGTSGPSSFLNGSIDSPAIHAAALAPAVIEARFAARADYGPGNPGVLPSTVAQWNFQELEGASLGDASGLGHDLTLVNHAHRSVPGPAWSGPAKPTQWSIRFSQVDRYNPPWPPTFSFAVPPAWERGFYLVSLVPTSGAPRDLPFIVKPAPGERAGICVLAATNTWAAYNTHGLYATHPGGDINCYVGLRQYNPGALANLHTPGSGYSHLTDAERYLWAWLRDQGYPFDIHTDLDLHRDPELLDDYRVVVLNGHSEYWSTEMMDHLAAFQSAGGSVVNLSGNTMWSRVTFSQDFTVMEGRKHPWGTRPSVLPPGERWHSQAGQVLGGTLRCVGRPEHELLGTGFGLTMVGISGVYQVLDAGHWAFAGTGAVAGSTFGHLSLNGGGILGFEADVLDPFWGIPAGVEVLARGVDFTAPALDLDVSDCQNRVWSNVTSGSEMIAFQHPGGGEVFGAPSVTFGGSLSVDPTASRVLRNVLERFLALSVTYCTAGTSASGCQASIAATGAASSTAASGFTLTAAGVEGQKDGLLFFGTAGRQANPWGNGTSYQCVVPPLRRTGLLVGRGSTGACDGSFARDLNALWCPSCPRPDKNPGEGAVVQAQFWYRDPHSTSNQTTSLSEAIEFYVGP